MGLPINGLPLTGIKHPDNLSGLHNVSQFHLLQATYHQKYKKQKLLESVTDYQQLLFILNPCYPRQFLFSIYGYLKSVGGTRVSLTVRGLVQRSKL